MLKFLFFLFLSLSLSSLDKIIYILPHVGDHTKVFIDYTLYPQESGKFFYLLKKVLEKEGYKVEVLSENIDFEKATAIITFNDNYFSQLLAHFPREKRLHFIFEPPVVMREFYDKNLTKVFGKIFVMFDDLIDNQYYFKFHYPQPRLKMMENRPSFHQKKLCAMIATNKCFNHPKELYRERFKIVDFILKKRKYLDLDLFGKYWPKYPFYKGEISEKWDVLKNYRFSFCYENMKNQFGYITEKIFDCFVSGCVPIYWGASNITDYVPKECFIDRRNFESTEEVFNFIKNMDENEYETYLLAIQKFLSSPQAHLFSIEYLIQTIVDEIKLIDR